MKNIELTKSHKRIIDYYNHADIAYRDVWDLNHSMAMHCGYWDKGVSNLREALELQNEVAAQTARVSQNDKVLDAGCGVGGSSIYLAKQFGCFVTGITLVEKQVDEATRNAISHGVEDKVKFELADYCATPFAHETFDVVWAMESACHAVDKEKFIKEAFRLLKPNGRLIISDGFATKSKLTGKDDFVMQKWVTNYAVVGLGTVAQFTEYSQRAGFINIVYHDKTPIVMRSLRRMFTLASAAMFYNKILKFFTSKQYGSNESIANTTASFYQYKAVKRNLWEHGIFYAEKP